VFDERHATKTKPRWYVAQTKRYAERRASLQLERYGLSSYLPLYVEWPRPPVGSDIGPLFPGYLFVRALDRQYPVILRTPGVRSLVCFGDIPATLDDAHIDLLRSREDPDGLIRHGNGIDVGGDVCVIDGPFRGFRAVLERRLPARDRVLILLSILRRDARVELPASYVARA
jgi:transcription antitermination factor NusG